jgi:5-methylcytosine-specific restriction enzyme subunit McrC
VTRTAIEPVKAWTRSVRRIDPAHALELSQQRVVRVSPVQAPDLWLIETDSKVGVLVGDGWELRIQPRLAIPKLLFLLAYSQRPNGWKELLAGFEQTDELFDAVAAGFSWQLERALDEGPLRGYVTIDERRNDFRGRVRFADQIAHSHGLPLPLEVTYDDFTPDVLENQLVLAATDALLRLPRIPLVARRRLLRARAQLGDVSPLSLPAPVRAPALTHLNRRYGNALALAELILNARSTNTAAGPTSSTTFLFDMNEVFESFVYAALRQAFTRFSGELNRHFIDYLDADRRALRVEPDITWWRDGVCQAVIDAKYKSLVERRTMPNADAYQMLAYCITLGLRRGYLIYAKGEADPRTHTVARHPYEIEIHALDVEAQPSELVAQVEALAASVAAASLVDAASMAGVSTAVETLSR